MVDGAREASPPRVGGFGGGASSFARVVAAGSCGVAAADDPGGGGAGATGGAGDASLVLGRATAGAVSTSFVAPATAAPVS